jgi:hypothetical protein
MLEFLRVLWVLSVVIGIGYPIAVCFYLKKQIKQLVGGFLPDSISQTYYLNAMLYPPFDGTCNILNPFRYWCWLTSFTLLPVMCYLSGWNNLLLLLVGTAISGLLFVGLFPHFGGNQAIQHYIGALCCAGSAVVWIVLTNVLFLYIISSCAIVAVILFLLDKFRGAGYLLEMVAVVSLQIVLGILLL